MTRFLAVIRRLFLAGLISLCLILILLRESFSSLITDAINHSNVRGWYSVFFLAAPILYLVFLIISVSYVRRHGQFAAVHASKPYLSSVFKCIGHDFISPFKNITGFFGALFNKDAVGRGILIVRFIEMLLIILICVVGIILYR